MAVITNLGSIVTRVVADPTAFVGGIATSKSAMLGFLKSAGPLIKGAAILGAGAAIVKIASASVGAFREFESAMVQSTAIMGDLTDRQQAALTETARVMAGQSTFASRELAQSYFFLASAGLNAEQSVGALPIVTRFAQAGMFDLSTATDLLTDAQSALGLTVQDAAENMVNMTMVSDLLVGANTLANASVQQFSTALTRDAGAAIKSYNLDLEDSIATLALYADQGIKAELAGSNFGRVVRLLTKSAQDNAGAFERLGISVFDDVGEFRRFSEIIGDMEKAFEGMSTKQRTAQLTALGFQARVQQAILPLIGGADKIADYEERLESMGGVTEEIAGKQLESLDAKLKILADRFTVLLEIIGERIVPTIKTVVDGFIGLADVLELGVNTGLDLIVANLQFFTEGWEAAFDTAIGAVVRLKEALLDLPDLGTAAGNAVLRARQDEILAKEARGEVVTEAERRAALGLGAKPGVEKEDVLGFAPRFAGALERGSAGAFSLVAAAGQDVESKIEQNTRESKELQRKQLETSQRTNELLAGSSGPALSGA